LFFPTPIWLLKGKSKATFPFRAASLQPISEEALMSTAAVSSTPINQQQYFQTRQHDLQQLGQALKSGDLAAAKTAFSAITALGQGGPFAGGNAFKISQRQQDFTAVGQALQSGDLGAARNAFEALKDTFHSTGANGGGPGGTLAQAAGGSGPGPEIIVNLTNSVPSAPGSGGPGSGGPGGTLAQSAPSSSSGAGPEIILNLGNGGGSGAGPEQITINIANSSSGEQVSLSVGHQGSPAQQFQFNLPANSPGNNNEQIVLNLLNSSSSSGTSTSAGSNSSTASGGLSVTA
jgi:hypothetical protein